MAILTGWRYVAFVTTIVGVCGAAIYPIAIAPMIDPTYYSEFWERAELVFHICDLSIGLRPVFVIENLQKKNRAGIKQEEIQPGSEFIVYCVFPSPLIQHISERFLQT